MVVVGGVREINFKPSLNSFKNVFTRAALKKQGLAQLSRGVPCRVTSLKYKRQLADLLLTD